MTLGKYIEVLKKLEAKHGKNIPVVVASDAEGNSFEDPAYLPSLVQMEDIKDIYFGSGARQAKQAILLN